MYKRQHCDSDSMLQMLNVQVTKQDRKWCSFRVFGEISKIFKTSALGAIYMVLEIELVYKVCKNESTPKKERRIGQKN